MKNVVVQLAGGLGNQMFEYAAARAFALRTKRCLKMDVISGFYHDRAYRRTYQLDRFHLKAERANRIESFMFPGGRTARKFLGERRSSGLILLPRYYCEPGYRTPNPGWEHELFLNTSSRIVFMEGYWQSERYFHDFREAIRTDFTLKDQPGPKALQLESQLTRGNSVAVCIRTFSEVPPGQRDHHVVLGPAYYRRAIEEMRRIACKPNIVVFTDNVDALHRFMPIQQDWPVITPAIINDSVDNLWIMSRCRHFIIGNSSYHWWAAWLGEKSESIVLAPNEGYPNPNPVPDRWRTLPTTG